MKDCYKLFLEALKASLNNETVQWADSVDIEQWNELFTLAKNHKVLPLIYEAVYQCPSAQQLPQQMTVMMKRQIVQEVTMQAMKTHAFLGLYDYLDKNGLRPIVSKGIVCRSIYPKPDHRPSGDEDILIPQGQYEVYHQALLDYGMQLSDPTMNIETSYEVPYGKAGSPIYIEVHKNLFPPEEDAYGELNQYFKNVFEHMVSVDVEYGHVYTMPHTDHLFYLICHAYKHFLHSGVGIRQVCDIMMFANTYGSEIDWQRVYRQCSEIHAEVFAAAMFKIGQRYLNFSSKTSCMSDEWLSIKTDEGPLLEDLLSGGVYGASDANRLRSSSITVNAVTADKKGKSSKNNVLKTIFPSVTALSGRYKYLKKYPMLLPVAWLSRILHYSKEIKNSSNNSAAESISIGNQRVALLKQYKIIK